MSLRRSAARELMSLRTQQETHRDSVRAWLDQQIRDVLYEHLGTEDHDELLHADIMCRAMAAIQSL